MARLRYNGLSTTLGGSLTSSATAVTFAAALTHSGGTNVPTIGAGDYIPLSILDAAGKVSEIVYLTAYTAAATTGTITRAKEGTTGVAHSSGDKVAHAPTAADVVCVGPNLPNASVERLAVVQSPAYGGAIMLGADGVHPNDTGMTYLADTYQAALAAAGKTPAAASDLYAYGDSWAAADTQNTAGQRAIVQLASRLSLTLTNRAASGDMAADVATRAVGTAAPFVAGTAGTVFIGAGFNDVKQADTAQQRAATATSLRSLFAAVCAAQRIEQTAASGTTGTWTTSTLSAASGGSALATTVNGSTATFTITTAGDYYLHTFGTDGTVIVGGVLTVTQGATTIASIDLNGLHVNAANLATANFGPAAVRLPNVAAGSLTITFSTSGRTGANGWVDALTRVSATPPTILAAKPLAVTSSLYAKPALLAWVRDLYDTMAAEFGANVVVADGATNWHPTASEVSPTLWASNGTVWTQPGALIVAGDASFTGMSLVGPWVNFGAPFANAGYRKDADGVVRLRGVIKSGALNTTLATLPVGYRPTATEGFQVSTSGPTSGAIVVAADGTIQLQGGSTAAVYLSGVAFYAA